MSEPQTIRLLEACIELEMSISALYRLFSELYSEDRVFWSQLQLEEKKHAALSRAALDSYCKRKALPTTILPASLAELQQANEKVASLLNECKNNPPSRLQACRIAIALEKDVGEKHYNQFMKKQPESGIETVFQQLNRNDKDHAERIADYLAAMKD